MPQDPNNPGTPQPPTQGPEAMAEQALKSAQQAVTNLKQSVDPAAAPGADPTPGQAESAAAAAPQPKADAAPFEPPAFQRLGKEEPAKGIDLLADVNLNVKIELGRTRMLVEDVLKLTEGAVVELDKLAGDPVDVFVNERHVARGEVLVLNDNFCVRINEIVAGAGDIEPVARKKIAGS